MDNGKQIELSVIIPVYNTKKYLNQCLDSIINQEYKNMEIILVDDGSTDGSGEICDQYQSIDTRIRVIHQKNTGSMLARFSGLKNSKGKYIGFIDSDDWIEPDMYKTLMSVAMKENCDIVSMGYMFVRDGKAKKEEDGTLFGLYEKGKNLDILLSNMMYDMKEKKRGVHPSLCSKVIRREYLMDSYMKVNGRITMGEDAAVFYPCCLQANRIFVLNEYKYYYRIHSGSMCRTMSMKTIEEIYLFYQYMKKRLAQFEEQYDLLSQLKKYVWTLINPGLKQIFDIQMKTIFLFPYSMLEKGTDIILYGAGKVGQAYYCQLSENHYCNVVAWADKDKKYDENIIQPDKIVHLDYSKVVIAVRDEKIADEIMEELVVLGINREKMIWGKPQEIPPIFFAY